MSNAYTTLILNATERKLITEPVGSGGHQYLHRDLVDVIEYGHHLDNGGVIIVLPDELLGRTIRCAIEYGSGGFQGRLRKALGRALSRGMVGMEQRS